MFENPRRGRQARSFTTNVSKILDLKSSSEQIFFRKLSLGAPVYIRDPARKDQLVLLTHGVDLYIQRFSNTRLITTWAYFFCLDIGSCRLNETIAIFEQEKYIMVISFRHLFFISLDLYCSYISTIWLFNPLFIYTDINGI